MHFKLEAENAKFGFEADNCISGLKPKTQKVHIGLEAENAKFALEAEERISGLKPENAKFGFGSLGGLREDCEVSLVVHGWPVTTNRADQTKGHTQHMGSAH